MSVLVCVPEIVPPQEFFGQLRTDLAIGGRCLAWFGRPGEPGSGDVVLTAALELRGAIQVRRTQLRAADGFHSLGHDLPSLVIFERELHEQLGVRPHDHPWLKPLRFPAGGETHPYYAVGGKEVHEVAVGPIHAGVIEPGHFRFQCLGERIHHLEIRLGYQHRGVERLLLTRPLWTLTPLVETIAGDASVAHAWAYCDALEALADLPTGAEDARGLGLELERVAMHLASLSAMCADIAFLQGAASYGRLRTTAINTSMLLCGSRFGRGWLRPGGVRVALDYERRLAALANVDLIARDLAIIDERLLTDRSVAHRLRDCGVLGLQQAQELGVVGPAARASGQPIDTRVDLPAGPYSHRPIAIVVEQGGDCWARARVRIGELTESLNWIRHALAEGALPPPRAQPRPLRASSLAIAVCESWRGEVVHAIETDAAGQLLHYKVQDPSLRNWIALMMAVRGEEISDFPINNKSFDLSYCGHDL